MTSIVSVVIPTLNEAKSINRCINSLALSDYGANNLEVVVVDALSIDGTKETVLENDSIQNFHSFNVIDNKHVYTPAGFNLGVQVTKGEYVLILSAHSEVSSDYISILVETMDRADADLVGGVFDVLPIEETWFSENIVFCLRSRFGAGNSPSRTGVKHEVTADTASGMYRRRVFSRVGLFNTNLHRNQDIEMSGRIRNSGGKIIVTPRTSYTYLCRSSLSSFLRQALKNGSWVVHTFIQLGRASGLRPRHSAPLVFFLYVAVLPLSVQLFPTEIVTLPVLFYAILIFFVSLSKKFSLLFAFKNLIVFAGLHLFYGAGQFARLVGFKKFL